MDNDTIFEHIMEIKSAQAETLAIVTVIAHDVNGNGQPGLKQKVEELQEWKSKQIGALAVFGALGGVLEYLFHRYLK